MAKVNNEHNFPAAHEHILSCVALQFCWGLGVDESCICKFPRLLVGLGAKEAAALTTPKGRMKVAGKVFASVQRRMILALQEQVQAADNAVEMFEESENFDATNPQS